jgi:hypothetical protein
MKENKDHDKQKLDDKVKNKPKSVFTHLEKRLDRNYMNRMERDGYKNLNRLKKLTFISVSIWLLYDYFLVNKEK